MAYARNTVCISVLVLLLLSELYSTLAIALDYPKAPHWEHALVGPLFALTCALTIGLVLLIFTSRKEPGFYFAASSLVLYAAFFFIDAAQAQMERGDWIAEAIWILFCAMGIAAARILMTDPKPR